MTVLLYNNILPLWTWIVIIVVGSLAIIGTFAFAVRCLLIRKRAAEFEKTFGERDLPERRVTVRKGRLISHASHLSLTGPRFGCTPVIDEEAAVAENEKEDGTEASWRNRSPFGWFSHHKERSHSRSSQRSQTISEISSSDCSNSIRSPQQSLYRHSQLALSNTSLSTTTTTKDANVTTTIIEIQPTIQRPPPINYSRSISRQGYHYPRPITTLSRIEEVSPHMSAISTTQSSSTPNDQPDQHGHLSHHHSNSSPSSLELPPSALPIKAPLSCLPPRSHRHVDSTSTTESAYHTASESPIATSPTESLQCISSTISHSSPEVFPARRWSSRGSARASVTQRHSTPMSGEITALPVVERDSRASWQLGREERAEWPAERPMSRKGNVLRKKSLVRAEMVSRAST